MVLRVVTPLRVKWPFYRGHLSPTENTDIYIMINNSSKITIMKWQQSNFMVGVLRPMLKGHGTRKAGTLAAV